MSLDYAGPVALDYFPCRYGSSRLLFRGPRRRLDADYAVFLGGAETYGKFTQIPFPTLVEHEIGMKTVNLGCANVGVDAYLNDPSLIRIANGAKVTIIEILGAQNMSNRYYAVHPRRNDRFVRASSALKALFPNMDFTEFSFVRHLLVSLLQEDATRFIWIEKELKSAWLTRMTELIQRIDGPVIFLWLADHEVGLGLEGDPMFVDWSMLEEIKGFGECVNVVVQKNEHELGYDELVFPPGEEGAAKNMFGPVAHRRVAKKIAQAVSAYL